MSEKKEDTSRRGYVTVAGGTIIGMAVGAAAGWYGRGPQGPATTTRTVTETAAERTIFKTETVGGVGGEDVAKLKKTAFPPTDISPYQWQSPYLPDYFVDTRKMKAEPPWTIGWSVPFMGNNWKAIYQAEILEWAKTNPKIDKIIWVHHNNDASDQIAGVRDFISKRVHGIVIDPASATGLAPVYKEAWDAGIPLVSNADPIDSLHYISNLTSSLFDMGYGLAKALFEMIGGKGNIVRFWGMPGAAWEKLPQEGLDAALNEYPEIKVVAEGTGLWDYTESKKAMTELIPTVPEGSFNAVWTDSGQMVLGILDALNEAGYDLSKITCAGSPLNGVLLYAKDTGAKYVAADSNVWEGREATKVLVNILEGVTVQKNYVYPMLTYTYDECLQLADPNLPRLTEHGTTFTGSEEGRQFLRDLFKSLGFD